MMEVYKVSCFGSITELTCNVHHSSRSPCEQRQELEGKL
uniref:Uncharacterized protein n=1 Tax=Rhizophora mucronata TaxID=61149 RepID=A0A2P2PS80_RHIMU